MESMSEPRNPPRVTILKLWEWARISRFMNLKPKAANNPMNMAPEKAARVPSRLTAPETPFSTRRKDLREMGLDLLKTPSSVAQVSALAAAKDTASGTKWDGFCVM